jgi:hypothetical protein
VRDKIRPPWNSAMGPGILLVIWSSTAGVPRGGMWRFQHKGSLICVNIDFTMNGNDSNKNTDNEQL